MESDVAASADENAPDERLVVDLYAAELGDRYAPATAAEMVRYLHLARRELDVPLLAADSLALRAWTSSHDTWGPSTRAWSLRVLRAFYGWLHREQLRSDDPTATMRPPRQVEAPTRAAGADVRAALVAEATTKRDRALVETLFGTGARVGEVQRLEVADVDIAAGSVTIRKTKAGRPRIAPIQPQSLTALREWLVVRLRRTDDHGALWLTNDDAPLTFGGVQMVYKRLARRAGVTFAPHDARRGYAEAWLAAGGSETGLQRALGWSSTRMVSRYSRANGERLAVEEAHRLFG